MKRVVLSFALFVLVAMAIFTTPEGVVQSVHGQPPESSFVDSGSEAESAVFTDGDVKIEIGPSIGAPEEGSPFWQEPKKESILKKTILTVMPLLPLAVYTVLAYAFYGFLKGAEVGGTNKAISLTAEGAKKPLILIGVAIAGLTGMYYAVGYLL